MTAFLKSKICARASLLLLFLTLALLASCAPKPKPEPVATMDLPRLPDNVSVDATNGITIKAFSESSATPIDPALLSAEAHIGWNPRGLAVLVTVHSKGPWKETETALNGYDGDSVEVSLRNGADDKKSKQVYLTPGMTPEHPGPRSSLNNQGRDLGPTDPVIGSIGRARIADGHDGYTLWTLIPWSVIDLDPKECATCAVSLKINKILASGARYQLMWYSPDGTANLLRLAGPGHSLIDTAAWISSEDPDRSAVSAIAPLAAAGKSLSLTHGSDELLRVFLQPDGNRSIATGWTHSPVIDKTPLTATLDGTTVASAPVPDWPGRYRFVMEMMARYSRSWGSDWEKSGVYIHVPSLFSGTVLPAVIIPDPAVAKIAGVLDTKVSWFGPDGKPVTDAKAPGRYGAIITVTMAAGDPIVFHQTCFRLPDNVTPADLLSDLSHRVGGGKSIDPQTLNLFADLGKKSLLKLSENTQAATLLAGLTEAAADGKPARPLVRDDTWWYAVRTAFGDATVYKWFSLMPDGYDADPKKKWPAIIYLHGTGGPLPRNYQPFEKRDSNRDLIGWAKNKGAKLPVAIYALQSFGPWEVPAVLNAIDRIVATDRIDPDRIIIMGFSMGGVGTWDTVVDHPERFAAAVPIAAGGSRAADVSMLGGRIPVWIFQGDADGVMRLENADKVYTALKSSGGNVKMTILPGIDHGGSQDNTFNTPGFWEWITAQKRVSKP